MGFFSRQIYLDIHLWFIYTDECIQIFIHPISMIANIFEISLFPKYGLKWLLLVQNGLISAQNNTKYEKGQNSLKQSWANNQTFEYILIFWTNIFIRKNFHWLFLDRIYSYIHLWSFYQVEYIQIFVCPISTDELVLCLIILKCNGTRAIKSLQ